MVARRLSGTAHSVVPDLSPAQFGTLGTGGPPLRLIHGPETRLFQSTAPPGDSLLLKLIWPACPFHRCHLGDATPCAQPQRNSEVRHDEAIPGC